MDLIVQLGSDVTDGRLTIGGRRYRCAFGKGGYSLDKREGDGATPIGDFVLRRLFFRPDRLARPVTDLPTVSLTPEQGWCDDPNDLEHYNRLVSLPHPSSHERLWREDHLYDLVVELGYNDDPPEPGLGSAIFMHVARAGYEPTEGCVALSSEDLLDVLTRCGPSSRMIIEAFEG